MSGAKDCRPAPSILWTVDAGQVLLADRAAGLYWTLTGIEGVIWEWLAAGNDGERVVELLSVMLSLSPDDAGRRFDGVLQGWLEAGILEPCG